MSQIELVDVNEFDFSQAQKEHLSTNLTLLSDPYGYFYEEEYAEENPGDSLDDEHVELNLKNFEKEIKEQFADAKKNRKKFMGKAMQMDPAFMLDPINDYYCKLLPKEYVDSLSDESFNEVVSILDPVTWGELNLLTKQPGGWKARNSRNGTPYQAQLIRSKSKRIVVRAGRRIGKTAALVVRLLHRAFTWNSKSAGKPVFNIVIFTPNQSQIKLIFKMMEIFIDGNPRLLSMIGRSSESKGKIPTRQQPHYTLELTNGVTFNGFVSGSTAIRGQAADLLVLDEASFLTNDDTDSVLALINEHKNVELFVSSTPKGLKDWFYERVHDPSFVSFYFPSHKYHPKWSKKMEDEFRAQLTSSGYQHEVLADFSGDGEGVFQIPFVESAFDNALTYAQFKYNPANVYGIGVDWNDPENGTQIKVVEFDKSTVKFRVVDSVSIHIEKWTQTAAVHKIKELNRKWRPAFIYVDQGHGGAQVENLHQIGLQSPKGSVDRALGKVKGIRFKSVIEVIDPWTKQKVRKETKPFMVNNAVRIFEEMLIQIPQDAQGLKKQLEGYVIDRITPSGVPVYAKDPKAGDHELDALLLALFGFTMELSSLGKYTTNGRQVVQINNNPLNPTIEKDQVGIPAIDEQIKLAKEQEKRLQVAKQLEIDSVKKQNGTTTSFNNVSHRDISSFSKGVPLGSGTELFRPQKNRRHFASRNILRNPMTKVKSRVTF